MKKVLLSLATIGAVAALAFGASQAFFSDTETSTGNILQAGAIDLLVDNTSYITNEEGDLVASEATTWTQKDLTLEKFFNFTDLKPGDRGEDTISLHVNNNDAWACASVKFTENSDNGYSEPEDEMSGTSTDLNDGTPNGDLAEELNFAFWADDGDNVLETDESVVISGPASDILDGATLALADSQNGFFAAAGVPLTGAQDYFIGKYFCYGSLTQTPVAEGEGSPISGNPARGTGFSCDGSAVTNLSQTDKLVADITFYVEQARNNENFFCNKPTRIVRTQDGFGDGGWAGWSCPAGTTVVGGGIDSSTNPVGGNGMAKPSAPAVDTFSYPVYPHYTFPAGETGYVVHDLVDGKGNSITFHLDCL